MDSDADIAERYAELAAATSEFQRGDASGFQALYAHTDDVSIFGGLGGHEIGWDEVGPRMQWAASQFQPHQEEWKPTPIAGGFGSDFGYLVWIEHTEAAVLQTGSTALQRERSKSVSFALMSLIIVESAKRAFTIWTTSWVSARRRGLGSLLAHTRKCGPLKLSSCFWVTS